MVLDKGVTAPLTLARALADAGFDAHKASPIQHWADCCFWRRDDNSCDCPIGKIAALLAVPQEPPRYPEDVTNPMPSQLPKEPSPDSVAERRAVIFTCPSCLNKGFPDETCLTCGRIPRGAAQEPQAQERCVCQQVPCVCDEQLLPAPAPRSAEALIQKWRAEAAKHPYSYNTQHDPEQCHARGLDQAADELEAALAAAPAPGQWQPIETAPKDGTAVLIHLPSRDLVGEARWQGEGSDEGWWWAGTDPGDYHSSRIEEYEVAHWMPLPAPPSAPTAQD